MRELLLLRHGKAFRKPVRDDAARALKDRGKRDAQRVGVWLAQQGIEPDVVIASPAQRALVTAEKCCKAMGGGVADLRVDQRLYMAGVRELLEVLGNCEATQQRVMLVGHNPGLEQLLRFLCRADPRLERQKLLPKAALSRLQVEGDWHALRPGVAELMHLQLPSDLPTGFPFPDAGGLEMRKRPAYYYRQSAVIPFRTGADGVEVLIVRSSQNRHWVVPKGIAEPGLTLQSSAAKEALEEAGVEGEVLGREIGSYRYEKWGGECTVSVYPMRVRRVLPENEWRERHRGRRWVDPATAAALLKQPELRDMALRLEGMVSQ